MSKILLAVALVYSTFSEYPMWTLLNVMNNRLIPQFKLSLMGYDDWIMKRIRCFKLYFLLDQ